MRRVIGVILAVLGVVAIAMSFVWSSAVVPALVKYPTDLDETPRYEGTVSVFLDQETYAPLEQPVVYPLRVERNIRAVADESTSDEVVVDETIDLEAEGSFSGTLLARYVMDRREMVNVESGEAWAFTPENRVDRAGAYRLAFPFDTEAEPVEIYKNEVETTYVAQPAGEDEVQGLDVIRFTAEQSEPLPITADYKEQLDALTPLPDELTLAQLDPVLKQAGLDVQAILPALLPQLSDEDRTALIERAGEPVRLVYFLTFSGGDAVEKSTGAIVEVYDVVETLWARPDPEALPALEAIFERYPDVPEAVTALQALETVGAQPIKVFENRYAQTGESVAEIAATVRDSADQKRLAEVTVPRALLIGGIVLTIVGLLLALWPRRSEPAGEPASSVQVA
jgi:hypothetical protein